MKKFDKTIVALVLLFVVATKINAQGGIYMKVAGIPGDVTTPAAYANSILVSSYQGGSGRAITNGVKGPVAGTPTVSEITLSMISSSATLPLLNSLLNTTTTISSIDFYFLSASCSCPYYRVHLEDVLLSGFSESSGGDTPTISVSLHFGKIAWAFYKANSTTITNTTGYDLISGRAFTYSFP